MTTIILIRHAAPNVVKDVRSDRWILSDAGREAAEKIAPSLLSFGLTEISSSPEPKAQQTAEIIAARIGCQISVDARLREHERKRVGFLARHDFESGIAAIFDKPNDTVFGDESAEAVYDRFCAGINDAASRCSGTVVAVTHGTAMTVYASRLCGIAPMPFWTKLEMPDIILIKDGVLRNLE